MLTWLGGVQDGLYCPPEDGLDCLMREYRYYTSQPCIANNIPVLWGQGSEEGPEEESLHDRHEEGREENGDAQEQDDLHCCVVCVVLSKVWWREPDMQPTDIRNLASSAGEIALL